MAGPIRIVLADDHPVVRSGLSHVIASDSNFSVVGEAADGFEALALIEKLNPDIAVVDIDMPKLDGFRVLRELTRKRLPVKVLFLTMHSGPDLLFEALDLGVRGYLLKDSVLTEIVRALNTVARGEPYITNSLTVHLLQRRSEKESLSRAQPGLDLLTDAERRVLRGVANDKSSKEIGEELCISHRTVENHRTNICQKLGIHGPNALLKFALQNRNKL